ncbi:MAG: hypothetical protein JWR34_7967 [Mycobacterium sp.]|nr:hypothetical protein [Mycobacterium sp.]
MISSVSAAAAVEQRIRAVAPDDRRRNILGHNKSKLFYRESAVFAVAGPGRVWCGDGEVNGICVFARVRRMATGGRRNLAASAVEVSVRVATIDQAPRASTTGAASQANAPSRGLSQVSTLQVEPAAAKNRASDAKM